MPPARRNPWRDGRNSQDSCAICDFIRRSVTITPIMLSGQGGKVPADFAQLLESLGQRPQPAVVFYGREEERVELSGRVLANWAVKLIGLFDEEYELGPEHTVLVDAALHWKSAAAVLAAQAVGAAVTLEPGASPEVIITDRPVEWIGSAELGEAELAALSSGMLDSSFEDATGEELPAWVLDISADVRQQPDQLLTALPAISLPDPGRDASQPLVLTRWEEDSPARMAHTWAQGGVVVLFEGEPDGPRWEQMRRNEGLD